MSNTAQPAGIASRATVRVSARGLQLLRDDGAVGQHQLRPGLRASELAGELDPVVLDQRGPDFEAHRLEEGARHGAADQDRVDLREQGLDEVDLAGDLGAAQHRHERTLRVGERLAEVRELLLHQEARHRRLEQARDRLPCWRGRGGPSRTRRSRRGPQGREPLGQRGGRSSPRRDRTGCSPRIATRRAAGGGWPSTASAEVGSARKVTGAPSRPLELAHDGLHRVLRDRDRPWGGRGGRAARRGRRGRAGTGSWGARRGSACRR